MVGLVELVNATSSFKLFIGQMSQLIPILRSSPKAMKVSNSRASISSIEPVVRTVSDAMPANSDVIIFLCVAIYAAIASALPSSVKAALSEGLMVTFDDDFFLSCPFC